VLNGNDCTANFSENYDDLPLIVRMWLTCSNWKVISDLAKALLCAEQIYYTDFIEENGEGWVCAMPLIITDGENAVVLAPKWIKPSDFEVKNRDLC